MSKVKASNANSPALLQQGGANALPLDAAPRVDLGNGREGRYGLFPVARLVPNPHAVGVHSKRQIDKLTRSMAISGTPAPSSSTSDM